MTIACRTNLNNQANLTLANQTKRIKIRCIDMIMKVENVLVLLVFTRSFSLSVLAFTVMAFLLRATALTVLINWPILLSLKSGARGLPLPLAFLSLPSLLIPHHHRQPRTLHSFRPSSRGPLFPCCNYRRSLILPFENVPLSLVDLGRFV